jgi:alkylhydroperoxidase family enzyme
MRLEILDRGHRLRTKALLALIRLVSRQPVVDAVKLALYRPDFYGGGHLTHEAMRGPSAWSIGDRELMAAFVSKVNGSPFCIAAHSATSGLWYGDAKVAATLDDVETADREPLRATLRIPGVHAAAQRRSRRHPRRAEGASLSTSRTRWPVPGLQHY